MTINTQQFFTDWYTANGANKNWGFDFTIQRLGDAYVQVRNDTTGVITDYDSGFNIIWSSPDLSMGTVVYPASGAAVAAGNSVRVVRDVPYTQPIQISREGAFDPQLHEQALDRLSMQIQQVFNATERAIRVPLGESGLTLAPGIADGRVLIKSGAELIAGPTADEVSNAQGYANDAQASANAAAASVIAAGNWTELARLWAESPLEVTPGHYSSYWWAEASRAWAQSIDPQYFVKVNAVQTFTEAQKGQAKANLDTGLLAGFRNKLINFNFDRWHRGVGPISSGYTADRWRIDSGVGATASVSKAAFVPNDNIPFVVENMVAWTRTVAGAQNSFFGQKIEGVKTLAGRRVTLVVWAYASVATKIRPYLQQNFGTGGSPSPIVWHLPSSVEQSIIMPGGGILQRYAFTFDLAKITGKTLGTNKDDSLWLLYEWLPTDPNATIYMTRKAFVEGDARAEIDPSSWRHEAEENLLNDRYFQLYDGTFFAFAASGTASVRRYQLPFRAPLRAVPNITWNSGDVFTLDERNQFMARWFTDPGSNGPERALGTIKVDAEL